MGGGFRGQLYRQLRRAAFSIAILGRSFRELLCRMALGSRSGEQFCRIAALGQQLWRTASGHSFGEQRRGAALGNSFGQLSRPALRQLRAAALEFWETRAALGSNCGQQLCGFAAASTSSCFEERQLWGAALGTPLSETSFGGIFSSFGEQLFGAAFDNNFGERLWGTALWSRFGERSSFEQQL